MPSTLWRGARAIGLVALSLSVVGCGDDPVASEDPIDPAGVWRFGAVVTVANGACDGEEGDVWTYPITITKTGSAPPYQVTATGFLGSSSNELTGTFSASNVLTLSGSYSEDMGTTSPEYELVAVSADRMQGTESWNWEGPGGTCSGSESTITADRID